MFKTFHICYTHIYKYIEEIFRIEPHMIKEIEPESKIIMQIKKYIFSSFLKEMV